MNNNGDLLTLPIPGNYSAPLSMGGATIAPDGPLLPVALQLWKCHTKRAIKQPIKAPVDLSLAQRVLNAVVDGILFCGMDLLVGRTDFLGSHLA